VRGIPDAADGSPDRRTLGGGMKWMRYPEAAEYTGYSVGHLRNLVSANQIPVYGAPRSRRFRADMLDLFLEDPDAALRKFRLERKHACR
jgi:excisionase family DNA binding protein